VAGLSGRDGVDATARPGEKSQFDVLVDGQLVFSKQREGRWPTVEEVSEALP
jgi:hypothetical protein